MKDFIYRQIYWGVASEAYVLRQYPFNGALDLCYHAVITQIQNKRKQI